MPQFFTGPLLITAEDMLLQIEALRVQAWQDDGDVPDFIGNQRILFDEHDRHGFHYAFLDQDKVVASARLCIHTALEEIPDPETLDGYKHKVQIPVACLTRLVVARQYRQRGLSTELTDVRLFHAQREKCSAAISITEQPFRIRSLQRVGFEVLGETRIRYIERLPSYLLVKEF